MNDFQNYCAIYLMAIYLKDKYLVDQNFVLAVIFSITLRKQHTENRNFRMNRIYIIVNQIKEPFYVNINHMLVPSQAPSKLVLCPKFSRN